MPTKQVWVMHLTIQSIKPQYYSGCKVDNPLFYFIVVDTAVSIRREEQIGQSQLKVYQTQWEEETFTWWGQQQVRMRYVHTVLVCLTDSINIGIHTSVQWDIDDHGWKSSLSIKSLKTSK